MLWLSLLASQSTLSLETADKTLSIHIIMTNDTGDGRRVGLLGQTLVLTNGHEKIENMHQTHWINC